MIKIHREFGDSYPKRITRFLYQWLWCSWGHGVLNPKERYSRCYPRDFGFSHWHCEKCHPCGEVFDIIIDGQKMGWL